MDWTLYDQVTELLDNHHLVMLIVAFMRGTDDRGPLAFGEAYEEALIAMAKLKENK